MWFGENEFCLINIPKWGSSDWLLIVFSLLILRFKTDSLWLCNYWLFEKIFTVILCESILSGATIVS